MEKIDKRLEVLLTKSERKALKRLAEHDGVSMGSVIRMEIRRAAKRKKLWK